MITQQKITPHNLHITLDTLDECHHVSHLLATTFPLLPRDSHHFILFKGDLGAGKSTFCRALIMHMFPHVRRVPSPTFTLMQPYEGCEENPSHSIRDIVHADLYRLQGDDDIETLGFEDYPLHTLFLIEWAERMQTSKPTEYLEIEMQFWQDSASRSLLFTGTSSWRPCIKHLQTSLQETI